MEIFGTGFLLWCSVAVNAVVVATASPALILTPYIKKNETEKARNLSSVDKGQFLNVVSYSGYITVDERYNSNLFFWYFPVPDQNVTETPWIIWLQGGPGVTSLAGLFEEIGPFEYETKLKLRNTSWGKNHSLLFIDNPVGTGFSFTDSDKGFIQNMDECSEHLYNFLQQFMTIFPELRKAPLYIAGESYAGRYVPAFAYKILQMKKMQRDDPINLQGLMLGNPVFNRKEIVDYTRIYYQWGLIDSQGVLAVKSLQDAYVQAINANDYILANHLRNQLLDKLDEMAMLQQSYNILKDNINVSGFMSFVDQDEIKEAIHVGDIVYEFANGTVHQKLIPDFLKDSTPKIQALLENYRILIYCGQLDLVAPCVLSAEGRRRSWYWSQRENFLTATRIPWRYNDSVAGYVKSGGRLTEVLVRGAGHLVPIDKPEQAQKLISYFIRDLPFRKPQNFHVQDSSNGTIENVVELPENGKVTYYYSAAGLIASVIINVIFVFVIVGGVLYYLRYKRRSTTYFYEVADEDSSITDGILTMT